MTIPLTRTSPHPRRLLRSTGAVFLGFITVVVLSLGTDQVLHVFQVYPPWGQPMYDPGLNLLALSYRIVYAVIGFVLSTAGAIATISMGDFGPAWYPIALVLTTFPCAWLGGALHRRTSPVTVFHNNQPAR